MPSSQDTLLFVGALVIRGLALAQTPTEPPLTPAPTIPAFEAPATPSRPLPGLPHYTLRLSGGIALIGQDIFCNVFVPLICPTSGMPIGLWPIVDAELEVWWARSIYSSREEGSYIVEHAVSLGASVIYGRYSPYTGDPTFTPTVTSVLWEPHFDVRWGLPRDQFWRFSLGFGVYIGSATTTSQAGQTSLSVTGGVFRIGVGVSFLPHEPVSLAVDLVGEAGWMGDVTVLNLQLLIGPELHFD